MGFYRSRHFAIPRFPKWDGRVYVTRKSRWPGSGHWTIHLIPGIRVSAEGHREALHIQADWLVWEVGFNVWAKVPWWDGKGSILSTAPRPRGDLTYHELGVTEFSGTGVCKRGAVRPH